MKNDPQKTFEKLLETSKNIAHYSSMFTMLHWDQETYMPPGGIEARSHQLALLSGHIHKEKTGAKYRALLQKLIELKTGKFRHKALNEVQKISLREWRRDFLRDTKLPLAFVKTFSQVTSEATNVWAKAKQNNSFAEFAPYLKKIVDLVRQKAKILGYKKHPYDPLIDSYEPQMTTEKLDELFSGLKKSLQMLLKKIKAGKAPQDSFLYETISHDKQSHFGQYLIDALKIDRTHFRMDESAHPFSLGVHPSDVRITTRILKDSFMSNILAILHECGHAFYELGLPAEYFGSPLCEAASLGIHESQSRWWETRIGRSRPFWEHFFPELQKAFPECLKHVSFDKFYHGIHVVEPSFIRIEADEVTYGLHIIMRYELEKDLLSGKLEVEDVPEAWKEKSQNLLGITPHTDAEGCLQDIHWSMGGLGYFPTYTLGNIYASQFFEKFEKDLPDWEARVRQGDTVFIRDWLKLHIHRYGRSYPPEELAEKVTGKKLSEKPYVNYLNNKYGKIYGF